MCLNSFTYRRAACPFDDPYLAVNRGGNETRSGTIRGMMRVISRLQFRLTPGKTQQLSLYVSNLIGGSPRFSRPGAPNMTGISLRRDGPATPPAGINSDPQPDQRMHETGSARGNSGTRRCHRRPRRWPPLRTPAFRCAVGHPPRCEKGRACQRDPSSLDPVTDGKCDGSLFVEPACQQIRGDCSIATFLARVFRCVLLIGLSEQSAGAPSFRRHQG